MGLIGKRKVGRELFWQSELKLLDEVMHRLPDLTREVLQNQISKTKLIQRLCKNSEANIYCSNKPGMSCNQIPLIVIGQKEARLAKVRFRPEKECELVVCTIWIVNGRLFQLDYSRPLPKLRKAEIKVESIDIMEEFRH